MQEGGSIMNAERKQEGWVSSFIMLPSSCILETSDLQHGTRKGAIAHESQGLDV
jgi:hypothetical protein